MIKVREVTTQPGFRLHVVFKDGTSGVVDMAPLMAGTALERLRDEAVFAQAYVERGVVRWPGDLDIAPETLYAAAHGLERPKTMEEVRGMELTMSLRELRKLADVSQVAAAEKLGMAQPQLSRFERADDRLVSSLRSYVAALGGELELVAVMGDRRVTLRGV